MKKADLIKAALLVLAIVAVLLVSRYVTSNYRRIEEGEYWTSEEYGGYYSKVSTKELVAAVYYEKTGVMQIYIRYLGFFRNEKKVYQWEIRLDPEKDDIDPDRQSFWTDRIEAVKKDRKSAVVIRDGR